MADTLIDKLRAKLDETEQIAREACDSDSGKWFVGRKWNVYRAEDENPHGDEEHQLVVWGNVSVQSDHIVHNDPASVLRQVAKDRKVLAECEYEVADAEKRDTGDGLGLAQTMIRLLAEGYGIEVEQ